MTFFVEKQSQDMLQQADEDVETVGLQSDGRIACNLVQENGLVIFVIFILESTTKSLKT